LLSGRDRLASIASPQSGQRFGVSGALMLDGMTDTAALDADRRWSGLVVLPMGRNDTGVRARRGSTNEFLSGQVSQPVPGPG